MKSILTMKIEAWLGFLIVISITVFFGVVVFMKVSELNNYIEINRGELYKEDILRLELKKQ